jgi:acyl-coenzyme A synthetase/AMP-(fatty) acid ligase
VTADYIAFQAADSSEAVALIINGQEISYSKLTRDIRKVTRALREFELLPGAKVLVNVQYVYLRWLLLLALERLCVITHALRGRDPHNLDDFDLVLSDKKLVGGRQQCETTPEWLHRILVRADQDEESMPVKAHNDPLRILFTSGTTGTYKKVLYSRRIHEGYVTKMLWFCNFTRQSRLLNMEGVAAATACIRAGGTLVFDNRMTAGEATAAYSITHVMLSPIALKLLLDELPIGFANPVDLKVFSSSAALSPVLRDRARARLATEVYDIYGTYEAGFISSIRNNAEFGSVWPGVQVEVVDDRDEPMPLGEVGQVRVKTDCMVQEYLNDPETTERMFKGGWFYARDLGILHSDHRLQIIGRSDDVLNITGTKISPNVLEDVIVKIAEVGDVGVCSIQNAEGIEEIFIAVSGAQVSAQELLGRFQRATGIFRLVNVAQFDQIPRTANGKIQRNLLKSAAQQFLARLPQKKESGEFAYASREYGP